MENNNEMPTMRVVIVRNIPGEVTSMDVYADELVTGLRHSYPTWDIVEVTPPRWLSRQSLLYKVAKYGYKYLLYGWLLARRSATIFHVVDHSYGHVVYALQHAGKRTLVTCHDLVPMVDERSLNADAMLPFVSRRIYRWSVCGLTRAQHVLAVSHHTAQDIVRLLAIAPKHITVIPNAVNPEFCKLPYSVAQAFRRQQGDPDDALCLLHVGSVEQRKNIPTILHVVHALHIRGVVVRLWKVGHPFTAEQQQFIRMNHLHDQVHYLGRLTRTELVQAYNAADALLLPSFYEGFGMTVLEAMACGTPVIASDTSSLPEVAGDAAVLVHPTDVDGMVTALQRLHRDSSYRRMLVERGLERAGAQSWASTAVQVADVYESLTKFVSV